MAILDFLTKRKIKTTDKEASTTSVNNSSNFDSLIQTITPATIIEALDNLQSGNLGDYGKLAAEVFEWEKHYRSCITRRKEAVAKTEAFFSNTENVSADILEALDYLVSSPEVFKLINFCMQGLNEGFSVNEILWDTTGKVAYPKEIINIPAWWLNLSIDRRTVQYKNKEFPQDGNYVVHYPRLGTVKATDGAFCKLAFSSYLFKNYTTRDWFVFNNRFGMPLRVGKYAAGANREEKDTLKKAIRQLGTDTGVVVSNSTMIEFLEKKVGGIGDYKNFIEFINTETSKAIVGQTMTIDQGSSKSQAEVHSSVEEEKIDFDAKMLAATLQKQLIIPFLLNNFSSIKDVSKIPRIYLNYSKIKQDTFISVVEQAVKIGVKVPVNYISKKLGIPLARDKEETAKHINEQYFGGQSKEKNPTKKPDSNLSSEGKIELLEQYPDNQNEINKNIENLLNVSSFEELGKKVDNFNPSNKKFIEKLEMETLFEHTKSNKKDTEE